MERVKCLKKAQELTNQDLWRGLAAWTTGSNRQLSEQPFLGSVLRELMEVSNEAGRLLG
jgi:hypothetical protein